MPSMTNDADEDTLERLDSAEPKQTAQQYYIAHLR